MTPRSSSSDSIVSLLICLFRQISGRRKRQFSLLLVLLFLSASSEVISLGAVVPFIGILTQPEKVFAYPIVGKLAHIFGISTAQGLILPLTVAFAMAAVAAGGLRLLLLWINLRLSNAVGVDISVDVYHRTLHQPYSVHVLRSSSEIISGITQKVGSATSVIMSSVTVVVSTVLFLAIMATLLAINPIVAAVAVAGFGSAYGLIAWKSRNRLRQNSQCIAQEQTHVVRALQEGLGAIRDVLLDGAQAVYCESYHRAVLKLQRANVENSYINQAPRFAMESVGMVLVAFLAYILNYQPGGIGAALPTLGVLALGAQRLLPLLQQLYGNWSAVAGSHAAIIDVLHLLDQPLPEDVCQTAPKPLSFQSLIHLDNMSFRYGDTSPWVLNDINLTIPKGARVGFVGSTGSGKSTMLDVVMGLLEPTQGEMLVDGQPVTRNLRRSWQRNIAHVPQSIFLTDSSMANNIAFGVPPEEVDMDRVREAARRAQIADFIEGTPEAYGALVGERGVRISGGQRQRIGIARALYKKSKVLVFDEATSALDSSTEKAVMEAIENLDRELTILIIAHRLSTLEGCDLVVKLEHGRIVEEGPASQFLTVGMDSRTQLEKVR